MWRPKEGWKNPFNPAAITVKNIFGGKPISHNEAYEAGADAMLEALKGQGEFVDASKAQYGYVFNHISTYPRTFRGWFILIPEEKDC